MHYEKSMTVQKHIFFPHTNKASKKIIRNLRASDFCTLSKRQIVKYTNHWWWIPWTRLLWTPISTRSLQNLYRKNSTCHSTQSCTSEQSTIRSPTSYCPSNGSSKSTSCNIYSHAVKTMSLSCLYIHPHFLPQAHGPHFTQRKGDSQVNTAWLYSLITSLQH